MQQKRVLNLYCGIVEKDWNGEKRREFFADIGLVWAGPIMGRGSANIQQ
jgi:hypothetical protein